MRRIALPALVAAIPLLMLPLAAASESAEDRRVRLLAPTSDFKQAEPFESFQGGSGTNFDDLDRNAFGHPSAALTFEQEYGFHLGEAVFDRPWVVAPSSTIASDGLGPLYNARACAGCHIKDGRGHPPEAGDTNVVSMLFNLGDPSGAPDPVFGVQLQDQAIVGMEGEGRVQVRYDPVSFTYPDGTMIELRRPVYATDAPLGPGIALKPRIAPPMIGLGLIEAIAPDDILSHADPYDADGDGISGRAHHLGDGAIGRFGWKATTASLLEQSALAFLNDMGLSTSVFPIAHGDCTEPQVVCRTAIHGDEGGHPEIADDLLALVTFYTGNLAVPARRDADDPAVLAGKELFYSVGCTSCHLPKFATRADAAPEQRNQLIWPYSDFLLHDLGPGLADPVATAGADGAEWRTQPLWGIGLTEAVNGHTFFLHDGRARSLEEAILWHGGEAEAARDAFANLDANARAKIIRFLESL